MDEDVNSNKEGGDEGDGGAVARFETIQKRVMELQDRENLLLEERSRMEEDFGHRRAKLKELYLQKEEELRSQGDKMTSMQTELEVLQAQVRNLQEELEEAHSAATIAQCTAENDIAVEQRKCQEEIATVHQLMKEEVANAVGQTGGRYEGEIKRLKKLTERLEAEKQHYRRLYERQLEESDRTKGESLLSPGVLSAVTKSLAKRVPSLSPSTLSTPEKTTANTSLLPVDAENLEDSMKKTSDTGRSVVVREDGRRRAQEDAELLRSLVEPLEQEIHALKEKIRAQDAQLRAHEAQQAAALHTADLVAPLLQGTDAAQVVKQLDEKLKGVNSTLEAEKASRADLELYTAILNTQKTALTDDVDRLRSQLSELRMVYEGERRQHRDLKHTWQRANDQFLEAQRLHLADMRRMQSLLTHEQMRKLQDIQRSEESVKEQSNDIRVDGRSEVKPASPLLTALSPATKKPGSSNSLDNEIEDDRSSSLLDLDEEPHVTPAAPTEHSDDQSSETESRSLPPDSLVPDTVLAERFSPDKMPQLTHDQQKALADMTPDSEGLTQSESLVSPGDDDYVGIELPGVGMGLGGGVAGRGRRVVSEMEWNLLNEEIRKARSRIGRSCQLCAANQAALNKSQSEYRESEKQRLETDRAVTRYREDLDREAKYRQLTEEKWRAMAEEYKAKVTEISTMADAATEKYTNIEEKFRSMEASLQDKLRSLTKGRQEVQAELTRLQQENDNLVGKHSQHSTELQNEIINLPNTLEDMQLLLLRYREDIIAAKVSKEHIEESLKSEILFLKDQVLGEQHEKNTIEDRLSSEIDQLREKVAMLESVESQMRVEQKSREESDAQVARHAEAQVKSQQIISGLKTQVAEQTQARARLESEVMELKGKVSTLQHELDNSEAVQRDFVRLSQSLQVQLEKIRQSEKEVRWQHEEDQEECNSCKIRFSGMGRRKHHCRHCGKIFCSECVSKMVPSGPHRRQSRVCDVCHTLLVQDATPYFSSEPPHSPD